MKYFYIAEIIEDVLQRLIDLRDLVINEEYDTIFQERMESECYKRLLASNSEATELFELFRADVNENGYDSSRMDYYYDGLSEIIAVVEKEYYYHAVSITDGVYSMRSNVSQIFKEDFLLRNYEYDLNDYNVNELDYETILNMRAASEIHDYIEKVRRPVDAIELVRNVSNSNDQSIQYAINYNNVIVFGDDYYCGSLFKISEDQKYELFRLLEEIVSDNEWHNVEDVFDILMDTKTLLLGENYIVSPKHLISFLNYFYSNDFAFRRTRFGSKKAELYEYLSSIEQNGYINFFGGTYGASLELKFSSAFDLFESVKDRYFLNNSHILCNNKLLGLTISDIGNIIWLIKEELKKRGSVHIEKLECIKMFPQICVKWNQWAVFSLIRQYDPTIFTRIIQNDSKISIFISLNEDINNMNLDVDMHANDNKEISNFSEFDEELDDLMELLLEEI